VKRIQEHDPIKARQARERAKREAAAKAAREKQAQEHREQRERGDVPGLVKKGNAP